MESYINVGCKYSPNDLDVSVWDGLVDLAVERQFVDRLVEKRREKKAEFDRMHGQARQAAGIPAPGQSLFK